MAIAIGVHNIPEGIPASFPLKKDGSFHNQMRVGFHFDQRASTNHGRSGSAPGWFFEPFLGIGLVFAGGAMIYLAAAEMLPEAIEEGGKPWPPGA